MPLKITLRKDKVYSPFRRLLNMLLTSSAGDSTILCSGYIWQPDDGRYNVLDDDLRNAILPGCKGGKLKTIAGKLYPQFYQDFYRNFVADLRKAGVTVHAFYAPKKNWHAKVAIRMRAQRPVVALIGSSNLTGPAYGENRRNWNYEADVLIWSASHTRSHYFDDVGINQDFGVFDVVLNPKINQPDEDSQLKSILEDVMSGELKEFE